MEQLSLILLQILELSLTLPQGYLGAHMHKHTSILTANHYPTLNDYRNPEQLTGMASTCDPVQNTDRANPDPAHGTPSQAISPHVTSSQAISPYNPPTQAISLHDPPISQVRVAEHTDVSMLTIVATSAPGLEIYEKSGATYQPVAHVPGVCVDGVVIFDSYIPSNTLSHMSPNTISYAL